MALAGAAGAEGRNLVAIVDGNATYRGQVAQALLSFYRMVEYPDSIRAMAALGVCRPELMLISEETPVGGGFALVRKIRMRPDLEGLPIILVLSRDDAAARREARDCGADAVLIKPYRRSALIQQISALVNSQIEQSWEHLPPVQRQALKGTVEIYNSISDVIERGEPIGYANVTEACAPLVQAVNTNDFKAILNGVRDHDNYSYAHSLKVATLLSLFGNTIGLPQSEQLLLASGGLLHDVGKMSIPHEVLNKPGRLTDDEFVVMRSHVDASVAYLSLNPDIPKGVITIAAQHHEKLDGTGYPHRLPGSKLNDLARMAAIVDVYGALTDRRVYKPSMPAEKALGIMCNDMQNHLDGKLLALFREMLLDAAVDAPV